MLRGKLVLAGLLCVIGATNAASHDWYPIECCSGYDCAPVEHVENTGRSVNLPGASAHAGDVGWIVTSKHGTGWVPPAMTRRESKDHRMHVCMRKTWDGEMRVICVFLPPQT